MIILNDFSTSVKKALNEIDSHWESLDGLIVCGSHDFTYAEDLINFIKQARESKKPFLGICFGHQLAFIEYCRNVLGIKDATSEEFGVKGTFVIKKLPQLKVGLHNGESYWNNYEIDPLLERQWHKPDNFITCQFHPEYQSIIGFPHPILVEFLKICRKTVTYKATV